MNTLGKISIIVAVAGFGLAGCTPDDPSSTQLAVTQPMGAAALTEYVAMGDAMTAGFMDGGLIAVAEAPTNGQSVSYPARIAAQLGFTGSTGAHPFYQPYVSSPGIGSRDLGDPDLVAGVLFYDTGNQAISLLGTTPRSEVPGLLAAASVPLPYHNLGVPGATVLDLLTALDGTNNQYGDNAYFDFILRNPAFGNVPAIGQAVGKGPTVVTLWIGVSDVLNSALDGNPEEGVNVTPRVDFFRRFEQLVDAINVGVFRRHGFQPRLVVGNVPNILAMPYFVPLDIFDQVVGHQNNTEDPRTVIEYVAFTEITPARENPSYVIPSTATLSGVEVTLLERTVEDYNSVIQALSVDQGFTVVDINALLAGQPQAAVTHFNFLLGQGLTVPQAAATTLYSLDGVNLNSQGQTLLANAFIGGINTALSLSGDDEVAEVDPVSWDPTYGLGIKTTVANPGMPHLTPEATAALRGLRP